MTSKYGLILFGDSVFLGIGTSQSNYGCGIILRSILQIPILIKAETRITTRHALNRIKTNILTEKDYPYVIILFGNNDCRLIETNTPMVPLQEYKENLKKIVQLLLAHQKTPIISNLQPLDNERVYNSLSPMRKFAKGILPNNWQRSYSDACMEVANSCRVNFIDIRTELEKEAEYVIASDGLHPNDKGHRLIASIMEKEIKNIIPSEILIHNEG